MNKNIRGKLLFILVVFILFFGVGVYPILVQRYPKLPAPGWEHLQELSIYVMQADGRGPVNLTQHPAADDMPAWSPDGKRIAFFSDRDGVSDLYTMNADGTDLIRLTDAVGGDEAPAWSPDGQYIVFQSDRADLGRTWQIYVMRADGSGQTQLTNNPFGATNPSWTR